VENKAGIIDNIRSPKRMLGKEALFVSARDCRSVEPGTSVSRISLDNGMAFGAMQNGKLFGE